MHGPSYLPLFLVVPVLVAVAANAVRTWVPEPWSGWLETVAQVGTGLALGVIAIALVGSWLGRRGARRRDGRARGPRRLTRCRRLDHSLRPPNPHPGVALG